MARVLRVVVGLALFAVALAAFVPQQTSGPIDNEWILVMNSNVTDAQRSFYASQLARSGLTVKREFRVGKFHGLSVAAVGTAAALVRAQTQHPYVKYMEQNQRFVIQQSTCNTQTKAVWGLDRISKVNLPLDQTYKYDSDGSGVDAYIVDTGVYIQHTQFEDRAEWGETFTDDGLDIDCNGHGTHVAGTVGGKTYGVAKNVHLIAVKVLDCDGSGSYDGVIAGISWVANRHVSRKRPSVANMSLGGPVSKAVDDAVDAAIELGVTFAVAAGNDNNDACRSSPADVKAAITVGSTEKTDVRSSFSNWGTCVDIFAPGTNIESAWIGNPNAIRTISGTSMATPHVCGAAARILGQNPTATPAEVEHFITELATVGVLNLRCSTTNCNKSPNLLLHSACGTM